MSGYFVKSTYDDGAKDESQIIEDFNRKIKKHPDHYVLSVFTDASGYSTSVACKCGGFHRIKNGIPDIENICAEDKARVPSIEYDIN